jgi:ssDNA-binding Zn-finger/Zn-ribbon topoisomerase 1
VSEYAQACFALEPDPPLCSAPVIGVPTYGSDSPIVREPRRGGTNGHKTLYSMTHCPKCGRQCAQRRGDLSERAGTWVEDMTCARCGYTYVRTLLPLETERAQRRRANA